MLKLNFYLNSRLICLLLPIVFFGCLNGGGQEDESFPYPIISRSLEVSKRNKLFIKTYDLTVVKNGDTTLYTKHGWLEKISYQNDKGALRISKGVQLVFPFDKPSKLKGVSSKFVEIVDEKWNYLARLDKNYGYKLVADSIPSEIILYTEQNLKKKVKLIFSVTNAK